MNTTKSQPDTDTNQAGDALRLTVHAMPPPQVRTTGRWKMLLILLACAAPVVASYTMYFVVRPEGRTNYASLLSPSREWPSTLALRDLNGQAVPATSLKGQWLLVAMGSAACDAACEKRLYTQRQMREMLGRERDRLDKVLIVLDDGDQRGDLRGELATALAAVPAVTTLRAKRADVAAWLGVDPSQVDASLYVVDPMGQWMMRTPVELEPGKFKRDLERLLRASSSWDRAGR